MKFKPRALAVAVAVAASLAGTQVAEATVTWSPSSPQFVYAPASAGMYAYAPSAVQDGSNTYYYTCHNNVSYQIKDHIYLSQVNTAGSAPQQDLSVMQGTGGAWDSNHVCDPAIVAARTVYNGTTYSLAMFYLGTSYANSRNEIGVAFSNSYGGPWVKYPSPIVTTPFSDPTLWGAGMPSATSVDVNTGRVMLFYSVDGNNSDSGSRGTYVDSKNKAYFRDITLGNMSNPIIGPAVPVTTAGLVSGTGGQDVLHNFDVAYDPSRDRFYMVRERHPFPTTEPWYISTELEVDSIPGSSIWNGTGTWTVEGAISPHQTGFARNHNPGIVKTKFGTLPNSNEITVVLTKSNTGSFPATLWGYNLWTSSGPLS